MTSPSDFPITRKWPPLHPDRLQLYTLGTPNGFKISIMLEETGLPYEVHKVSFQTQDQFSPEFVSLNPNGKIPAIIDPAGPGGQPIGLFESGAILFYLAEKTGRFMPPGESGRYETMEWLMFQMANIGPLFGQLGFFYKYAGSTYEDKRPLERYATESRRLLGVLDERLRDREWTMGDGYSIVDMAIFPWVNGLITHYLAGDLVGIADFPEVTRVLGSFMARSGVQRGMSVP
jgi:GSH-dependent disulfide-bond oxidoreductase